VVLAQDLLDQFGSLHNLLNANEEEFCKGKGLGPAKYANLRGVMAMARSVIFVPVFYCHNLFSISIKSLHKH
jgi:DNA repair protein RadC